MTREDGAEESEKAAGQAANSHDETTMEWGEQAPHLQFTTAQGLLRLQHYLLTKVMYVEHAVSEVCRPSRAHDSPNVHV